MSALPFGRSQLNGVAADALDVIGAAELHHAAFGIWIDSAGVSSANGSRATIVATWRSGY
jgi:hypothetical protein